MFQNKVWNLHFYLYTILQMYETKNVYYCGISRYSTTRIDSSKGILLFHLKFKGVFELCNLRHATNKTRKSILDILKEIKICSVKFCNVKNERITEYQFMLQP